jgi:YVTN family beta-propeller protein
MNDHRLARILFPMVLVILLTSAFVPATSTPAPTTPEVWPHGAESEAQTSYQGWFPSTFGNAVTADGKTAYVTFDFDDAVFVIDLETFTIVDSIDVSPAGSMLGSGSAVLSQDGNALYVSNVSAQNLMVIDTQARRVTAVLPLRPLYAVPIALSDDGNRLYVPSVEGLYIVQTADLTYEHIHIPGVVFGPVVPSSTDPHLAYCIGAFILPPDTWQSAFFLLDTLDHTIRRHVYLSDQVAPPELPGGRRKLVVDPTETRAYYGWLGGTSDKGVGCFNEIDLSSLDVQSTPMENGVADFALNEDKNKIYLLEFWSGGGSPNSLEIREWDIATQAIARTIPLSPSSDQRAIVIDPSDADYLYMSEGDFNLFRKVEISTGKEVARIKFNKSTLQPYAIVEHNNIGYIGCHRSQRIFKLDLASGELIGSFLLPQPYMQGWGFYQDKFYVSDGNDLVYALDPSNGAILETYHLSTRLQPIFFTFYGDKMAALDYETAMIAKRLLVFDANTMTLIKAVGLPREPYGDKVIVSPDGSKLYIAHGPMWGVSTIEIYDAQTVELLHVITIPPGPQPPTRGVTSFIQADFDQANRIVYLAGWGSIYRIDMDTNALIDILDVYDVYALRGADGWPPTGLSGVILSPRKDKLFVTSLDSHCLFTYDLARSAWDTKITNLRGFFNTDVATSPDRRYLYVTNERSDSVTMVDLSSGDVVKVIDLGAYLHEFYLPLVLR